MPRIRSPLSPVAIAKFTRPHSENLLKRERLLASLSAIAPPIVWVHGPPGSGKTSLIVDWLASQKEPQVWYQVDAADGDAETLFHQLSVASQNTAIQSAPGYDYPSFDDSRHERLDRFARKFFRTFFGRLPPNTILTFDNFQDADPQGEICELLRCAAEELQSTLRIIVISREPPPATMAGLRAQQRLQVLDWPTLRFSAEECAQLVEMRFPAASHSAGQIHRRCGGWVGGLILTLEHMRRAGDIHHEAVDADVDSLFDYFATQVLAAAGEHETDLLLCMSYLTDLTTDDARIISGSQEAPPLLEAWARKRLFIDVHAGSRRRYRFHPMFRAFLQQRARAQFDASRHRKLSNLAAERFDRAGDWDAAFALYAEVGAHRRIHSLIHSHAKTLLVQGRRTTLHRWIMALPQRVRECDAWLLYWEAIASLGEPPANVRGRLESAYHAFEQINDEHGKLVSAAAAADSFFSDSRSWSGIEPWIDRLDATLCGHDPLGMPVRARALMSLLRATLYLRPSDTRLDSLAMALERIVDDHFDADIRLACGGVLLAYYFWRRNGPRSEELHRRLRDVISGPGVSPATRLYYLFWRAVEVAKSGDRSSVEVLVLEGRALTDDTGLAPLSVELERYLASSLIVRGESTLARTLMLERLAPALSRSRPVARAWYHNTLAACDLAEGLHVDAQRHITESLTQTRGIGNTLAELLTLPLQALVEIERGQFDEADAILGDLLNRARNPGTQFDADALRVYASAKRGEPVDQSMIRSVLERILSGNWLPAYGFFPALTLALLDIAAKDAILKPLAERIALQFPLPCPAEELSWRPNRVKIITLGPFEVTRPRVGSGSPAKPPRRLFECLQLIVAAGPSGVRAEVLADLLWPHSDGDTARKSLDMSLYRLRLLLGIPEALSTRNGYIVLDQQCCSVDAWEFEILARRLLSEDERSPNWGTNAQRALDLYRGHFVENESVAVWIVALRERLRRLWIQLISQLHAMHESAAHWTAAALLMDRAIAIDPANEDHYRKLMTAQMRIGDLAAAARTGDLCRSRMAALAGGALSRETRELLGALARPDL